jgi:hypothetical protein
MPRASNDNSDSGRQSPADRVISDVAALMERMGEDPATIDQWEREHVARLSPPQEGK